MEDPSLTAEVIATRVRIQSIGAGLDIADANIKSSLLDMDAISLETTLQLHKLKMAKVHKELIIKMMKIGEPGDVLLGVTNYKKWSVQVRNALCSAQMIDHIHPRVPKEVKTAEWCLDDIKMCELIRGSVSSECQPLISDTSLSAAQIWGVLSKTYNIDSFDSFSTLLQKISTITLEDCQSVLSYFKAFKQTQQSLMQISDMPEEFFVSHFLRGVESQDRAWANKTRDKCNEKFEKKSESANAFNLTVNELMHGFYDSHLSLTVRKRRDEDKKDMRAGLVPSPKKSDKKSEKRRSRVFNSLDDITKDASGLPRRESLLFPSCQIKDNTSPEKRSSVILPRSA